MTSTYVLGAAAFLPAAGLLVLSLLLHRRTIRAQQAALRLYGQARDERAQQHNDLARFRTELEQALLQIGDPAAAPEDEPGPHTIEGTTNA